MRFSFRWSIIYLPVENSTNNDAPCKCPMDSEKDFTGITIYANRSSYYDPEKDEIYHTVDEFIRFKLDGFPEWFIFRGETSELDKYMIKKQLD